MNIPLPRGADRARIHFRGPFPAKSDTMIASSRAPLTNPRIRLLFRAKFHAMPRFFSLLLLLVLLTAFVPARAKDSLFDNKTARKLTAEEQKRFGPQSGELKYDARMRRAAEIAIRRAQPKMTWYCWRYVKDALLAAHLVSSRPTSAYAKQAGTELVQKFGFKKLNVSDPRKAPIGAVVVYGGDDAGHVELRTATGFVSDFISPTPYPRPLVGVFVKAS